MAESPALLTPYHQQQAAHIGDKHVCDDRCLWPLPPKPDQVNHPAHYTAHPSGVECIEITEHMVFNLGNAVKYIWRADLKHDAIQDLLKARWYVDRELKRRGHADG